MKDQIKMVFVVGVLCIIGFAVMAKGFRSCGTEVSVTCPGGAEAKVLERGNVGGSSDTDGVCEELEGGK